MQAAETICGSHILKYLPWGLLQNEFADPSLRPQGLRRFTLQITLANRKWTACYNEVLTQWSFLNYNDGRGK